MPFVVRLDGTNDEEGRALLAEADLPNVHTEATMLDAAAARSSSSAARDERSSSTTTRSSCVSGHHRPRGHVPRAQQQRYGTNVVAGVTPGKGGQDVEGIPVFDTFHDAVAETGANTAMIFVPPRFAADSILEAADAGIELIIAITEGIPAHDELRVYNHLAAQPGRRGWSARTARASSRRARRTSASSRRAFFKEGNVGVVSRSGTLTYQIGNELAQRGFGNSIDRRHRRRPGPGHVLHRRASRCSRPTRRPS